VLLGQIRAQKLSTQRSRVDCAKQKQTETAYETKKSNRERQQFVLNLP